MLRATVPETAIYENSSSRGAVNEIGLAKYITRVQFDFAEDVIDNSPQKFFL